MKIPQANITAVQSLGRQNLGATGALAGAKGGLGRAQAQIANTFAELSSKYIERKERMEYDKGFNGLMTNATAWETQFGAKKSFEAKDVRGMIPAGSVNLTETITGPDGKQQTVDRKNIQPYEVYGLMLGQYLDGEIKAQLEGITNNNLKTEFAQNMREYRGKKLLTQALRASEEQYNQERTVTKARVLKYAQKGDIGAAQTNIALYNGTDAEREALSVTAFKLSERAGYAEAIRTEDVPTLRTSKKYLKSEKYESTGKLNRDENITEQKKIESKLGALKARNGATDRLEKEQGRQVMQDAIFALGNGEIKSAEEMNGLQALGSRLKLEALQVDLNRAYKKSAIVDAMWQTPDVARQQLIDERIKPITRGDETSKLRAELLQKSLEISSAITEDPAGVYLQRGIGQMPDSKREDYLPKLIVQGRLAAKHFGRDVLGVNPGLIPQTVAKQLARSVANQTPLEKRGFIEKIIRDVPDPVERDAIFRQMDAKGAGSLNVYADVIDRGLPNVIEMIDRGRGLRTQEKQLKLVPSDIGKKLDIRLASIFPPEMQSQRRDVYEAVTDIYATLAREEGLYDQELTNRGVLKTAIALGAGNVVEYAGKKLMLPNNDLTARTYTNWVNATGAQYIDQLGGVRNMASDVVTRGIRDEDLQMRPTGVRGWYFLTDANGQFLMKDTDPNDPGEMFIFKYDQNRPERKRVWKRGELMFESNQ